MTYSDRKQIVFAWGQRWTGRDDQENEVTKAPQGRVEG